MLSLKYSTQQVINVFKTVFMVQLLNTTVLVADQVPTPTIQPEYADCSMDY